MRTLEHTDSAVTAYLNAGGRGTRLGSLFHADPEFGVAKALLELGDPAIKLVDHHIANMAQAAFRNIVIGAGDQKGVSQYIEKTYRNAPHIVAAHVESTQQLGTAGDLLVTIKEHPELFASHVFVNNVDTILELDIHNFISFHHTAQAGLSIALTRKRGVPNEDAFHVNSDNRVIYSAEAKENARSLAHAQGLTTRRGSSTGALIIETAFLKNLKWDPAQGPLSLYQDVMALALQADAVAGYDNGDNFFIDVGTVANWLNYAHSPELQSHLCYYDDTTNEEVA